MSQLDFIQNWLAVRPREQFEISSPRRGFGTATAGPAAGANGSAQVIITLDTLRQNDAFIIDYLAFLAEFLSGTSITVISADAQILTNTVTGTGVAIMPAGQNESTTTTITGEHSFNFAEPPMFQFEDLQFMALRRGAGNDLTLPTNQPLQLLTTLAIHNGGAGAASVTQLTFAKWRVMRGLAEG